MTTAHPHEHLARTVCAQLSTVPGVLACAVRAQADPPKTPEEVRETVEHAAAQSEGLRTDQEKRAWVEHQVAHAIEHNEQLSKTAPAPFPHVCDDGAPELCHYLRGLSDLLAPVDEDRIDAKIELKIGATRFVAESWHEAGDAPLLVAVAIPQNHAGVKSLMRGLRRIRKKNRRGS